MTTSDPRVVRGGARAAWLLGAGLTAGWLGLLAWVHATTPDVPALDSGLHDWAVQVRTPESIDLANAVSVLGQVDVAVPLAVVGVVLVESVTRRWGARVPAVGMAVLAGGGGGRRADDEPPDRPRAAGCRWAPAPPVARPFPSGHTTAATVAALLLAWAVTRVVTRRRAAQVAVWIVAALWAVGVGWSRVWLGVHWPTDVLAAWLFVPSLLVLGRAAGSPGGRATRPDTGPRPSDTPGSEPVYREVSS